MSVLPNVFATALASTPRMESLKLFCVSDLTSCAITTLVYSGTCGRSDAMIMFTHHALDPAGRCLAHRCCPAGRSATVPPWAGDSCSVP